MLLFSPRIINALRSYIKHSNECFIRYPNTSKLVKKTRLRLLFSTHFSVFGYLMKHSSSCLIYYFLVVALPSSMLRLPAKMAARPLSKHENFLSSFVSARCIDPHVCDPFFAFSNITCCVQGPFINFSHLSCFFVQEIIVPHQSASLYRFYHQAAIAAIFDWITVVSFRIQLVFAICDRKNRLSAFCNVIEVNQNGDVPRTITRRRK